MQAARDQFDISERQACRYLRVNRRMVRYVRIAKNDAELRARLEELAAERRRFGFRRLAVLLRRDGMVVNIKRVLRVYREANLQVRKRVRRRVALGRGNRTVAVSAMNERWSLDFVHDSLESGRRIRTLNIVDERWLRFAGHRIGKRKWMKSAIMPPATQAADSMPHPAFACRDSSADVRDYRSRCNRQSQTARRQPSRRREDRLLRT